MKIMKKCSGCGLEKCESEFGWKNTAAGTRHKFCKSCKSRYNKTWYKKNRLKHGENVRKNSEKYFARNRKIIDEARDRPCADCKQKFPLVCMDFDHLRDKEYNVSRMLLHSEATLRKEMEKCEVVCANCHRIRTATRLSTGAAS